MPIDLTKIKYCKGMQCPKILWMDLHMPEKAGVSESDESAFDMGNKVGELAREYFGKPPVVTFSSRDKMVGETRRLINNRSKAIAEASFSYDSNFCSVDILLSKRNGYELIEVKKSSAAEDEGADGVASYYLDDMAYQYYVLTNCGIKITKASIMQLNRNYIRKGDLSLRDLFVITNCTGHITGMQEDVVENINAFKDIMIQKTEPDMQIGAECMRCVYANWCLRRLPENNIFEIGWGMRRNKKNNAYESGIITFNDVLRHDIGLSDKQLRQVNTEVMNLPPHIEKKAIKAFLTQVKYPLYHLDFESYQQIIPLWDNVSPYMQIPFQYSLHIQKKPCGPTKHKEFLGKEGIDPRRELAERLCADIPMGACVIAYNMNFEKMIIRALAQLFPNISKHLMEIHDNMTDLMKPFQAGMYYCRKMGGSYSIKNVLPALCPGDPEVDYKKLDLISNGSEAMNAYAFLHEKASGEIEKIRKALLAYCRTDTLAMVKVLNRLYEIVK